MAGKPGGFLGLTLAIVLVGAIAATPFYLGFLRAEDRALAEAVSDDSEAIRRAVSNLDHELALLDYMLHSGDDPDSIDAAVHFRFGQARQGIWPQELMRDLDTVVDELTQVEMRDADRGTTVVGKGTINRLRPRGEDVLREAMPHLKSHDGILRRADAAMNQVRSVTVGDASAMSSLDVNRVRALYLLAKARVEIDRARFERSQASVLRSGAEQRATSLSKLRAVLAALEAKQPDAILEKKQEDITRLNAGATQVAQAISGLSSLIESRKAQLASLRATAAEARSEMEELVAGGELAARSDRYAELSEQARTAEAEAAAIQNGTLAGAEVVAREDGPFTLPSYEGGTPQPGLSELEYRLEQLQSQEAALNAMRDEINAKITELGDSADTIAAQIEQVSGELTAETARIREQLSEAAARSEKAVKNEDAALKFLTEAATAAKSAVAAAKKRASDAMQAAGSGESVDERLQRVSQDFEAEAYVQSLVGLSAFKSAMVRFERLQSIRSEQEMQDYVATLSGSAPSASLPEEAETLQTEAANDLAEAGKAYEQAATLINRVNLRFPDNSTISGKNYLWEAQVGQAACHLLSAALVADDRDASFAAQTKAYDLLKEAVEKKEQSPLLASALDTIIYLQKNAR